MILASFPFLEVFWEMLIFFGFVVWIWLLFIVFGDIFRRHDTSGLAKVLWIVLIVILPYFGVFVYLIAEHDGMTSVSRGQTAGRRPVLRLRQADGRRRATRPSRSPRPRACSTAARSPRPSSTRSSRRHWREAEMSGEPTGQRRTCLRLTSDSRRPWARPRDEPRPEDLGAAHPRPRHPADDPRDLLDLGRSPAAQPDQLVEHQHSAAAEGHRQGGHLELPDRPALRERRRTRRRSNRGCPRNSSHSPARRRGRSTTSPNRGPKRLWQSPQLQDIWRKANYAADQTLVRIVNGGGPRVQIEGGTVSLNLRQIVAELAARSGAPSRASPKSCRRRWRR